MRRLPALLVLALLAACHPAATPFVALAAADAASIAVFHRDGFDLGYSLVTGRDCSIVRLDQGLRYCKAREPPPRQPAFCTRSLGVVDCYDEPWALPGHPQGVADGPRLNAAQEEDRTKPWPGL